MGLDLEDGAKERAWLDPSPHRAQFLRALNPNAQVIFATHSPDLVANSVLVFLTLRNYPDDISSDLS
jgi:hypothetical protein